MNNVDNTKRSSIERVQVGLARRYRKERRFRLMGLGAIGLGLMFLVLLFTGIISNGLPAFQQSWIKLDIDFNAELIDPDGQRSAEALAGANYSRIIKSSLKQLFPDVSNRKDKKRLYRLVSSGAAYDLRDLVLEYPNIIGTKQQIWVLADDEFDLYVKGYYDLTLPEADRRFKDIQVSWAKRLEDEARVDVRFNTRFFTAGDSRNPELAGIRGAAIGSLFTLLVTLLISFPIGVASAIYLEEFAPKTKWTDLIEVNINNLAAVPSIVFGLLGLAVFINFFGLPRSVPLVGGLVLTLMTLPTIIIASRAALKSVPPSIRQAALGIGASKMQTITHHVLPLAMPGMLTGTIIGMAQALGETAPLLMIGMVAFIVDVPGSALDPSTVLPVQIYLWADSPERAFVERTSAAIMVLLGFLIVMNFLAVILRRKFERRW